VETIIVYSVIHDRYTSTSRLYETNGGASHKKICRCYMLSSPYGPVA